MLHRSQRPRRPVARAVAVASSLLILMVGGGLGAPSAAAGPVPPPAPAPTSGELSPGAPDPSPPLGGVDPSGKAIGGPALLRRDLIVPPGSPPLPENLAAAAWILADLDTGAVLAARDPHGRYQPASILKVLTSLVLLPQLPGQRKVTVSADAANTEGSAVGLVPGGTYSVDDLFSGLLLMSGNDTAMALAEAAGGADRTVASMNKLAQDLGAYDTFVETPSGLDGWSQLTSAYDMALVLREAAADERFVQLDSQLTGALPAQNVSGRQVGPIPLGNQGMSFLSDVPGALIAKSGFTDAALSTYLAAAERDGRRLGVVFLRNQRHPLDQWQQASVLLDWGYALPAGTAPVGQLAPATVTRTTSPAPVRTPEATSTTTSPAAAPSSASAAPAQPVAAAGGPQLIMGGPPPAGGASMAAYLLAILGMVAAALSATTLRRALALNAVVHGSTGSTVGRTASSVRSTRAHR